MTDHEKAIMANDEKLAGLTYEEMMTDDMMTDADLVKAHDKFLKAHDEQIKAYQEYAYLLARYLVAKYLDKLEHCYMPTGDADTPSMFAAYMGFRYTRKIKLLCKECYFSHCRHRAMSDSVLINGERRAEYLSGLYKQWYDKLYGEGDYWELLIESLYDTVKREIDARGTTIHMLHDLTDAYWRGVITKEERDALRTAVAKARHKYMSEREAVV